MNYTNKNFTSHCVVYPDLDSYCKLSGVIFNENLILSTAATLAVLFEGKEFIKIINTLKNYDIVDCAKPEFSSLMNSISYSILYNNTDKNHSDSTIINNNSESLHLSKAKVIYIFNSKNIANQLHNILRDFSDTETTNEKTIKRILTTSFILLKFENESFDVNVLKQYRNNRFGERTKSVYTLTTPFGNNSFFNTQNYGIVSNILGKNDCLAILSNSLVHGCQGGGVYDVKNNFLGLILETIFVWNEEIVNLCLAASMHEIVCSLFKKEILNPGIPSEFLEVNQTEKLIKHIVLVDSSKGWGTGCLVRIDSFKFIITCAHVIDDDKNIKCYWMTNKTNNVKLLYKNSNYNKPYDIAILNIESNAIPDQFFATISKDKPIAGEVVYSIGFPFFKNLGTNSFKPCIFDGRVTKYQKGILFTDCSIQSGQSGGPLFNTRNELVGITVSNSVNEQSKTVYPNINMSVPMYDIKEYLFEYKERGDKNVFKKLVADINIVKKWNLESPPILSQI